MHTYYIRTRLEKVYVCMYVCMYTGNLCSSRHCEGPESSSEEVVLLLHPRVSSAGHHPDLVAPDRRGGHPHGHGSPLLILCVYIMYVSIYEPTFIGKSS